MKRPAMMAVLLLIMAGTVQAQSISDEIPESEFGFSIGFGSQVMHDGNYNDMRHYVERELGWASGGTEHFYNIGISLGGEYYRQISTPFAVGLTGGFAMATSSYEMPGEMRNNDKNVELTSIYVMPAVRWTWFRYKKVRLYSRGCLGVRWQNVKISSLEPDGLDKHQTKLAYHLGAAGAELGHKNAHVFFEVGYGMCGVVNMGFHFAW